MIKVQSKKTLHSFPMEFMKKLQLNLLKRNSVRMIATKLIRSLQRINKDLELLVMISSWLKPGKKIIQTQLLLLREFLVLVNQKNKGLKQFLKTQKLTRNQVLIKKLKISKSLTNPTANTVVLLLLILLTQIKIAQICQGLVDNIAVFLEIPFWWWMRVLARNYKSNLLERSNLKRKRNK